MLVARGLVPSVGPPSHSSRRGGKQRSVGDGKGGAVEMVWGLSSRDGDRTVGKKREGRCDDGSGRGLRRLWIRCGQQ